MVIGIWTKDLFFADPTKVVLTLAARHVVASHCFLYWCFTNWTHPILHFMLLCKIRKVKINLAWTIMEFIATLKTNVITTDHTHTSITTAWLVNNTTTICRWAVFSVLRCNNFKIQIRFFKLFNKIRLN